jgi:hypothetical protein
VGLVRIELHVDELVLHGFSPHDRHRIGDAVRAELARALAAEPLPAQRRAVPQLDAGSFVRAPRATAEVVGTQIAGAVHRGLRT